MKNAALFTDGSVDPRLKLGVGAYVMLSASLLEDPFGAVDRNEITRQLRVRRFTNTSSTRLELQTVLWAMAEIRQAPPESLTLFSDSQCVSGLINRKPRLLAEGFISKKTNQPLANASLYRTFYELHDELGFHIVKVPGHSGFRSRNPLQRVFSCVDRETRSHLKIWLSELAEVQSKKNNSTWCVYVLRCSNDSLYIGMTNNLEKRLEKHRLGQGSKFVRSWRPFELVKTIPCGNAEEARMREYDLKKLTRKKKIEILEL